MSGEENTYLGTENAVGGRLRFGGFKLGIEQHTGVHVNVFVFDNECASLSSAWVFYSVRTSMPPPRSQVSRMARKRIRDVQPFQLRQHSRRWGISSLKLGRSPRIIPGNFRRGMA